MKRKNKNMTKKMLSVMLAAAMVVTGGAFQSGTAEAAGSEVSASANAQFTIDGSLWELYGNHIVRNETGKVSYILQADGTAEVSQADTDITECMVPAAIPFTYSMYDSYLNDLNLAAATPSPDDYFNDSNKSAVTTIVNEALKGCVSVKTVKIEDGVSRIGKDAFASCPALMSLYVPDSVTSMGYDTVGAGGAAEADITDSPSSCTIYCSEGAYAENYAKSKGFAVAYTRKTVAIDGKSWKVYADYTIVDEQGVKYQLNQNDTNAKVTGYDKSLAASAVSDCTIPKSIPLTYAVCAGILKDNPNLNLSDSATLASTVVAAIEEEAFKDSDLEKIIIEADGVKEIGKKAFADCAGLKAVQIPNTVSVLGDDILDGTPDCTVYCWKSSKADSYAQEKGYTIKYLDDTTGVPDTSASPSPTPTASEQPSASPDTQVTPVPEQTATPSPTQQPANTRQPDTYVPPVAPQTPSMPQTPVPTVSPSVTATPDASPAATAVPDSTETPSVTSIPNETAGPSVTDAPTETPDGQQVVKQKNITYQMNGNKGTVTVTEMGTVKAGKVVVPATVTVDGVKYSVTTIGKNAFAGNKSIKTVTLGKNVTTIGEGAFKGCKELTSIKFPLKLTTIQKSSFNGCTKLATVTIPKNIRKIGKGAFKNCKKLKSVKIGAKQKAGALTVNGQKVLYGAGSVKLDISASAFENCVSLRQMVINSLVRRIGNSALKNCKSTRSLIVNSKILQEVAKKALKGVNNCKISVPGIKLKPYSVLFKNKGQGKKVIVAKI